MTPAKNNPPQIVFFPDPRLLKVSAPVSRFDADLTLLAARMLQLMRDARGVGLAAPQVGLNIRMFVMNPTGQQEDDRVLINPEITDPADAEEAEEGCLSLPGINALINRARTLHIRAQDLSGRWFERTEVGWPARIIQHEFDHLNGILILDRMGAVARMTNRKTIRELQDKWAEAHPAKPAKKAAKPAAKKRPSRKKSS
jgi:peptide deformylase